METAKVDIRKLQLLNDRINQCIDALNQVRLSVHGLSQVQGLSHSNAPFSGVPGVNPAASYGAGFGALGASPFASPQINAFPNPAFGLTQATLPHIPVAPGFLPGLAHTSAPFAPGLNPYMTMGTSPTGFEGLGEAAIRSIWADPYLTARITQTFPYAQFPAPPVVTIY